MRPDDVLHIVDLVSALPVDVWVDGGWGVDALVGRQTRDHGDVDLVIDADGLPLVDALLRGQGFELVRDWRPTAMAFAHVDGREVDLHPVELTGDGGGDQIQPDGRRWHYDPPVTGHIGGRAVRCCSLASQIAAHLGYEPDEDDVTDMAALAERFGCALPPPYGSVTDGPW